MSELKPVIVERPEGTHVEIVDEYGFTGHDPEGSDILEAYIAKYGQLPQTEDELRSFGDLALHTADYHRELFEIAKREMDLFGIEEPDLNEVGYALSLDTLHSHQVYPVLSEARARRFGKDATKLVG